MSKINLSFLATQIGNKPEKATRKESGILSEESAAILKANALRSDSEQAKLNKHNMSLIRKAIYDMLADEEFESMMNIDAIHHNAQKLGAEDTRGLASPVIRELVKREYLKSELTRLTPKAKPVRLYSRGRRWAQWQAMVQKRGVDAIVAFVEHEARKSLETLVGQNQV